LDIAQGDWIGFVDSDDWCDDGMFQFLYDNALKYDADVSICGIRNVSGDGSVKQTKYKKSIHIFDGTRAIIKMFTPGACGGYSFNKLVKFSLLTMHRIRYDESKKYMEDILLFYTLFKHVKRVVYSTVPYYNYVSNPESVTMQTGLTEAAMTGLSVFDMILSIEPNRKIKMKVIHSLVIFERNLCTHYISRMKTINDKYYLLRKDIIDKLPYILIDVSFPLREKLLSCLVLFPKLWRFARSVFLFKKRYLI
jgi:glycosyltransferase involved in cell wall biosynthesis